MEDVQNIELDILRAESSLCWNWYKSTKISGGI